MHFLQIVILNDFSDLTTISFTAEEFENAPAVVAIPKLLPFAEPYLISGYELLVPIVILPDRFNDELIVVALFNVVFPDTFKDDIHVVILFNVAFPEIFNVEMNVPGLLKLIIAGGFVIAL
jgi:hypothetical protein